MTRVPVTLLIGGNVRAVAIYPAVAVQDGAVEVAEDEVGRGAIQLLRVDT